MSYTSQYVAIWSRRTESNWIFQHSVNQEIMSLLQVSIRWNQSQALSQRVPRVSKTEGSPVQIIQTRSGPRAWRTADNRQGATKRTTEDERPQTISYRLPKLPGNILSGNGPTHPYVYKESFNESQFLLWKDSPPRTAVPVTSVTTYDRSLQTGDVKRRDASNDMLEAFKINRSGLKANRLFPPWIIDPQQHSESILLPQLTDTLGKPSETRTPPQSEADANVAPALNLRDKEPAEEIAPPAEQTSMKTKFPAVFAQKSSDDRKLTWQLSPYDNKNFDKQGLGPNQGPFSRELPKKCMPPANWLRMKLRHRIQVARASRPPIRIR